MKALFILYLIIFYPLSVFSQDMLAGNIVYGGKPVGQVLITNTENGRFAISDENGDFKIEITKGSKNTLEVFHLAYKEKFIELRANDKFLQLELERAVYISNDTSKYPDPLKLAEKVAQSFSNNYLSGSHYGRYLYKGVAFKESEMSGELKGEGIFYLPDLFDGNQDFEVWWRTSKRAEFTLEYSPKLVSLEYRAKNENLNSIYFALNNSVLYSLDNAFVERFDFKVDSIRDYKGYKIIALSYKSDGDKEYIIKPGGTFYIFTLDYSVLCSINYSEIPENSLLSDIAIDSQYLSYKETLYHKVSDRYYPYLEIS